MREKLRNYIVQGCPVKQIETDHLTITCCHVFQWSVSEERATDHINCPSKALPDVVVPKSHADYMTGS